MPAPSPTWTTRRVFITYRNPYTGLLEAGTWEAVATARVTNTLANGDRQVFRKGKIAAGALNTTEGLPSFSYDAPVVNDPDNSPQGGEIVLTVTFNNGGQEVFHLSPLESWSTGGTDLALILDPEIVPEAPPVVIVGVAGGVAKLDSDGDVRNAAGVKVLPGGSGGGGTSLTNYGQVSALSGYPTAFPPALGTTGTTAAAGNDSRLSNTRTPTDASVTNAKVAAGAGITLDKTADSTDRLAMTAAERTRLAGMQTGATANSTDAFLLDRANGTGTQAIATVTGLQAALDDKAKFALSGKFVRKDPTTGFWPSGYDVTTGAEIYTGGSASTAVRPTSSGNVTVVWIGAAPKPADAATGTGGFRPGRDLWFEL